MTAVQASVLIRTHSGDVYSGTVPAGSPGHHEALSWREKLAGWQVTHPDERLPFGPHRIRVGDVASIDVGVPRCQHP